MTLPIHNVPTRFNQISGLLAGLAVVMIWSGWIIVSKWGLSRTLTVWDVTGIRFATAGSLVLLYTLIARYPLKSIFTLPVIICSLCCGVLYPSHFKMQALTFESCH
jgi:drug/metabolite transporter (DMT)-like permease